MVPWTGLVTASCLSALCLLRGESPCGFPLEFCLHGQLIQQTEILQVLPTKMTPILHQNLLYYKRFTPFSRVPLAHVFMASHALPVFV